MEVNYSPLPLTRMTPNTLKPHTAPPTDLILPPTDLILPPTDLIQPIQTSYNPYRPHTTPDDMAPITVKTFVVV